MFFFLFVLDDLFTWGYKLLEKFLLENQIFPTIFTRQRLIWSIEYLQY